MSGNWIYVLVDKVIRLVSSFDSLKKLLHYGTMTMGGSFLEVHGRQKTTSIVSVQGMKLDKIQT